MRGRAWQGARRRKSLFPGTPRALPALRSPVPRRRGRGCNVTSKESGHISGPRVWDRGAPAFPAPLRPMARRRHICRSPKECQTLWAQLSPKRDRRTRLPWGGMLLGIADGSRYRGKCNTSSRSQGQQPFPAKGSPLEGKTKHKQAKPTQSSPSENRGLLPCSAAPGPEDAPRHRAPSPVQGKSLQGFSSCSSSGDEQLVHGSSDGKT